MGCSLSSKVQGEEHWDAIAKAGDGIKMGREGSANDGSLAANATEGDLHKRMVSSKAVEVMRIDAGNGCGFTVRYAFASQRGYYPEEPNKANQDSFAVVPSFCGDRMSLFCGVFDGHGGDGDLCSNFVAEVLPKEFEKSIKASGDYKTLSEDAVKDASKLAHVYTNEQLHATTFDDSQSGTTAISVLLKGDTVFVANVGDSRAIICSQQPGKEIAVRPLSVDQTPFRKDERERIKKAGGHVLTIDQIEGLEPIHENWDTQLGEELDEMGDPPRVWLSSLDQPGCAFTRSLGDSIGERVGVFAEPEQFVLNVTKDDRSIVIASDGVFEFITSYKVMEAVERFKDPLSAAKHIVQESFRTWLQYEVRTDDITIIVIFIEDFQGGADNADSRETETKRRQTAAFIGESVRPVRRYFSKGAKSRLVREGRALKRDEETFDVAANEVPKTAKEQATILKIVKDIFLFRHLSPEQIGDVIRVIKHEQVVKGDVIIRQGDEGDKFYVVDSGEFDVSVADHEGVDSVISHICLPGDSFGELSLMYGKPRTATVTCVVDGWLWCLERKTFRGILVDRMAHDSTVKILRKVKTLRSLSTPKLQQLSSLMEEESFVDQQYIITHGEDIKKFFIIVVGTVKCYAGDGQEREEVATINAGGFFGESALLQDAPAEGSFTSNGITRLLSLKRSTLEEKIGPLQAVIDQAGATRAKGQAMKEKDVSLVTSLQGTTARDLKFRSWAVQLGGSTFIGQYEHLRAQTVFSVKISLKKGLLEEGSETNALGESKVLAGLMKPNASIPTQLLTFQDAKCIYSMYKQPIMCELASLLEHDVLPEATARFYAACIISAIALLHDEGFIQRNATPNCICITDAGYAQLTDLSCSKKMDGNKAYTMVGDPHYMAPEQISGQGYGFGVDYWSLGILMFTMLHAETPFAKDKTETQVYTSIASFSPQKLAFSNNVSSQAQHLICSLLEDMDWDLLERGLLTVRKSGLQHFVKAAAKTLKYHDTPPTSEADIARLIGDRSDPEFEREFFSNSDGVIDARVDATFAAF